MLHKMASYAVQDGILCKVSYKVGNHNLLPKFPKKAFMYVFRLSLNDSSHPHPEATSIFA